MNMPTHNIDMMIIETLQRLLQADINLELSVLVGSQASGSAKQDSDWDIAIRWHKVVKPSIGLEYSEILKQKISDVVGIDKDKNDLIDIATSHLAMKALIVEEGMILKGNETLAWSHFVTQTWAELEDRYWRKKHVA